MPSRSDDSPLLLPGEASAVLSVFAFLFASAGILTSVGTVVVLVGTFVGWPTVVDLHVHPLSLLVNLVIGPTYIYIAFLLTRARRLGGYLAIATFVLSAAFAFIPPESFTIGSLIEPALSLIAVLLCWRHLEPKGTT